MVVKKWFGSQLKLLLSAIDGIGARHLVKVENDLLQTNILLEEAITKLSANFLALAGAVQEQQEIACSLAAGAEPTNSDMKRMAALSDEISLRVNNAVTGLQFQDMTNQVIGRSLNRIIGLRSILGVLSSVGATLSQKNTCEESTCEEFADMLEKANETLAIQSEELNKQLAKTVRQQHMEGGSIELF